MASDNASHGGKNSAWFCSPCYFSILNFGELAKILEVNQIPVTQDNDLRIKC
jgi:hypothetical protein